MLAVIGISTQRLVYFSKTVDYIELPNRSNQTNGSIEFAHCNNWVCTSDFIFAVALLINLGKLFTQPISNYIINFLIKGKTPKLWVTTPSVSVVVGKPFAV